VNRFEAERHERVTDRDLEGGPIVAVGGCVQAANQILRDFARIGRLWVRVVVGRVVEAELTVGSCTINGCRPRAMVFSAYILSYVEILTVFVFRPKARCLANDVFGGARFAVAQDLLGDLDDFGERHVSKTGPSVSIADFGVFGKASKRCGPMLWASAVKTVKTSPAAARRAGAVSVVRSAAKITSSSS
jgi:hypothetical protein